MTEEEPSIEVMMLHRFLEAAHPRDILRWHKAELEKAIQLAKAAALEEPRGKLEHERDLVTPQAGEVYAGQRDGLVQAIGLVATILTAEDNDEHG